VYEGSAIPNVFFSGSCCLYIGTEALYTPQGVRNLGREIAGASRLGQMNASLRRSEEEFESTEFLRSSVHFPEGAGLSRL
jgi:hypothetical protein